MKSYAFSVNAWEKLPGYPETVLAAQGTKIESNGPFKNNIEIAFVPSSRKLLKIAFSVNAWEKLPGYPEPVLAAQGTKIESNGPFKNNIEIAFVPSSRKRHFRFHQYEQP
ncbi:hypothetical protein vBKpnAMK4_00511 [Klebsiella phage vB_Kpn_AM_K4]